MISVLSLHVHVQVDERSVVMVIGAVAVGPVSGALMTREDSGPGEWPREELVRIARTSLFEPPPVEANNG